jgi:hydrogenase maturation protease
MNPRLLVAGIGNIFFGDDAFGSEVARELMKKSWPQGVRVDDFGIRSYDLAYALMDGVDALFIDITPQGGRPGTLYVMELEMPAPGAEDEMSDAHSMNPVRVLQMVQSLGGKTGRLYLLGCEPGVLDSGEGAMGLSEPVQAAVPLAIRKIESLVNDLLAGNYPTECRKPAAMKEVS